MPNPFNKLVSPEEYLVRERASRDKNEYFEGRITALAGASLAHNNIMANLVGEIRSFLKDKPCRILPSEIRISVPSRKSYMYPDAVIVCGDPELEDDHFDTLKNPMVIFEVLSPSTRSHDRSKKFFYYQQIPSFREYVLVDSTERFVEVSRKGKDDSFDNTWQLFDATADPYGHVFISSIHYPLSMEEIYRNVTFGPKPKH